MGNEWVLPSESDNDCEYWQAWADHHPHHYYYVWFWLRHTQTVSSLLTEWLIMSCVIILRMTKYSMQLNFWHCIYSIPGTQSVILAFSVTGLNIKPCAAQESCCNLLGRSLAQLISLYTISLYTIIHASSSLVERGKYVVFYRDHVTKIPIFYWPKRNRVWKAGNFKK